MKKIQSNKGFVMQCSIANMFVIKLPTKSPSLQVSSLCTAEDITVFLILNRLTQHSDVDDNIYTSQVLKHQTVLVSTQAKQNMFTHS